MSEQETEKTAAASEAEKIQEEKQAKKTGEVKPRKRSAGKKTKTARQVPRGRAYIQATYNNTMISLTDQNGDVLAWSSAGICGFRGPKKATPYAAGIIVKDAVEKVKKYGLQEVSVFVQGIGAGREAAIRALNANNIEVISIKDVTPIPHGGCRPPKPRRL